MELIPFDDVSEPKDSLKVTFSAQNGTAAPIAFSLANKMNVNMFGVIDQNIPNEDFAFVTNPNPQVPESFDEAKKVGDANGSELLFATDPDADRFGLVIKDFTTGE
jgi:phosphomannomutase